MESQCPTNHLGSTWDQYNGMVLHDLLAAKNCACRLVKTILNLTWSRTAFMKFHEVTREKTSIQGSKRNKIFRVQQNSFAAHACFVVFGYIYPSGICDAHSFISCTCDTLECHRRRRPCRIQISFHVPMALECLL
jgi:hypothetical protein